MRYPHPAPTEERPEPSMDNAVTQRMATFLVQEYGSKAAAHAAENLHWTLAHDDEEDAENWRRVIEVIEEVQAKNKAA